MNKRMKIASTLSAVALAAGVGAGVAYAAIPNGSTGVISGCYSTLTGSLKVIDAQSGATCGLLEKPLAWNQAGPQGPAGPTGATGPSGAVGATGAAGSNASISTVQESAYTPVYGGSVQYSAEASCPAGDLVTGGGYTSYVGSLTSPIVEVTSEPDGVGTSNQGWTVVAQDASALIEGMDQAGVHVYAICTQTTS